MERFELWTCGHSTAWMENLSLAKPARKTTAATQNPRISIKRHLSSVRQSYFSLSQTIFPLAGSISSTGETVTASFSAGILLFFFKHLLYGFFLSFYALCLMIHLLPSGGAGRGRGHERQEDCVGDGLGYIPLQVTLCMYLYVNMYVYLYVYLYVYVFVFMYLSLLCHAYLSIYLSYSMYL
jgi:hypothetical protein